MKKIISRRELANALNNGGKVRIDNVSKKLNRVIEMWISYNDIKREGNFLIGTY